MSNWLARGLQQVAGGGSKGLIHGQEGTGEAAVSGFPLLRTLHNTEQGAWGGSPGLELRQRKLWWRVLKDSLRSYSKAYIDPSGISGGLAHQNYMLLRATGRRRKSSKVNQTLKPESVGISVESVEWVLFINTYWAWVGTGFWLATKKMSSWGAQTLTSSQDLYLPYFWSDHSLLPTWKFWEQEALPRQWATAPQQGQLKGTVLYLDTLPVQ